MNTKAVLYTLLVLVIGYGIYYYFFIRPTPPASNATSGSRTTDEANTANPQQEALAQLGINSVVPEVNLNGIISVPLDIDGKIVPRSQAVNFLRVRISETPVATCYKNRTIYVSRPSNVYETGGILHIEGVHVSSTAGCATPLNI